MENLTISDPPPQQHGGPHAGPGGVPPSLGRAPPAPQQQQLPAQMFTTAAQLLDLTDSRRLFFVPVSRHSLTLWPQKS